MFPAGDLYNARMDPSAKDFLFRLLNTHSPTGFELRGQEVWAKEIGRFADSLENDAYGNTWATIKGKSGRTLMLEAHIDEIGYMVKHVMPGGYIAVDRIGGSDVATARGRRVSIYGEKGHVPGIIGNIAIHIRECKDEKVPQVHELVVDVGAKDEKEVKALGIRVGNPIVYSDGVTELGKHCITGRGIDNRLGGFIMAEVFQHLKKSGKKPLWTIHAVNAVQEEIGGFGARMVAHRISPDAAVVFDVTHATDTPGIKHEQYGKTELRKGPTVTHGGCNHPLLVRRLMDVATKKKIPLQHEASSRHSSTDTNVIYHTKEGIPSALVSLPLRYMHSAVEMVDLLDVEQTIELLTGFIASLTLKDDFAVKVAGVT